MHKQSIAGLSMTGGRKDNFYFCLLNYFKQTDRWFLTHIHQVRDEDGMDGNEALLSWIDDSDIEDIVVDFPLTKPHCFDCSLACPGDKRCVDEEVVTVRGKISELLMDDFNLQKNDPKAYERKRLKVEEVDYSLDLLQKKTDEHLLSKSFKRRLKKGYNPHWNRPIDFWIWKNYYDPILNIFNHSYDSYGQTSLKLFFRLNYLRRHIPAKTNLYEANASIILVELLRAKLINKHDLMNLSDLEQGSATRLKILKLIEEKYQIFIYEKDLDLITQKPKAFESFLLSLAGHRILSENIQNLPDWTQAEEASFLVPKF